MKASSFNLYGPRTRALSKKIIVPFTQMGNEHTENFQQFAQIHRANQWPLLIATALTTGTCKAEFLELGRPEHIQISLDMD